jgi:hypothetical protein
MALNSVLLPLFGWPKKMTVGASSFIGDDIHHDPADDASAQGNTRVGGQVPDQKRSPKDTLGVHLDKVIFVESQSEQTATNPLPALDLHYFQLSASRRPRQTDHLSVLCSYSN